MSYLEKYGGATEVEAFTGLLWRINFGKSLTSKYLFLCVVEGSAGK
jgi:hypothetical protein